MGEKGRCVLSSLILAKRSSFFHRHSKALLRPSDFLIFLTSCSLSPFHILIAFACRFLLATAIVTSMIQPPMIVRNDGISSSNTNAKMIP
jgi:hypothetical protein